MVGASNLTISLPIALKLIMEFIKGPKFVYVAHGPGRSYLKRAGLPMLRFQGISICGLFDDLESAINKTSNSKIYALVTDIGDDLLYTQKPDHIAEGVKNVLKRLRNLGAEIGITLLPKTSIQRLSPARYYLLRTFYNPFCHVSYDEMMANIGLLTNIINKLCVEFGSKLLKQNSSWYGFDHIHLFGHFREIAYRSWFSSLFSQSPSEPRKAKISSLKLILRHFQCYQALFMGKYYPHICWQLSPETELYLY